jgi:hypothetical protein
MIKTTVLSFLYIYILNNYKNSGQVRVLKYEQIPELIPCSGCERRKKNSKVNIV